MADIKFKVLRKTLPSTAGGTVDFTETGFGTVKAAIFIFNDGKAEATRVSHAVIGVGFWDGTNQAAGSVRSQDNLAASNTARSSSITRAVLRTTATSATSIPPRQLPMACGSLW